MTKVRISPICPPDLQADAAQFAMVAADTPLAADTYSKLVWQNGDGDVFALASFEQPVEWITAISATLPEPDFEVDMVAAARAQAALVLWTPADGLPAPTPQAGRIVVVIGLRAQQAASIVGLTPVGVA